MKFFHLSDLHIGKQLHQYNLREDQEYILDQIVEYAQSQRPDAVVIAGDIYDKSVPSGEAVKIFDHFLTRLADITPAIPVLLISGNHDSAQRLEFASEILGRQHVYIAGMPPQRPEEHIRQVVLNDQWGQVHFYLLPFLKPGYVRGVFGEKAPESYSQAVEMLLDREQIDASCRNVLVSHQFYTGQGQETLTCDSETVTVGGIDNVDIAPLKIFDYGALGHIHRPQDLGSGKLRYCGTPLKYSVSESGDDKSLTVVTLEEKGKPAQIECLPLRPLRDVRRETGLLAEILDRARNGGGGDYVSVTLTDEQEAFEPRLLLEEAYSHILEIRVDNSRTRRRLEEFDEEVNIGDPMTAFADFYQEVQGVELSLEEKRLMQGIIDEAKEGDSL